MGIYTKSCQHECLSPHSRQCYPHLIASIRIHRSIYRPMQTRLLLTHTDPLPILSLSRVHLSARPDSLAIDIAKKKKGKAKVRKRSSRNTLLEMVIFSCFLRNHHSYAHSVCSPVPRWEFGFDSALEPFSLTPCPLHIGQLFRPVVSHCSIMLASYNCSDVRRWTLTSSMHSR